MQIVSINVNGIRAAARKGFFEWLAAAQPDIVCLQEVRAHPDQIQAPEFWPKDYHCYYVPAEKKGYSGVAIYSKKKPNHVGTALGYPLSDEEGRFIQIDYDNLNVASLYLPSGTSGEERQQEKYGFMDFFGAWLAEQQAAKRSWVVCGDWNIAHKQIDIKNWRANQKNSGFLPEERAWLDQLFDQMGWVDAFRQVNQDADQYTWWSNRGRAWDNNVGWRIDYQIISPDLADTVQAASVYKESRFSDHAPLIIDYDLCVA